MGLFYEPVQIDEIMYVDKLHKIYMKISFGSYGFQHQLICQSGDG